jgi:GMP synthase (glutamine-hydrolysing)
MEKEIGLFHVIRHAEIEGLGLYEPVLQERGVPFCYVDVFRGDEFPAAVSEDEGLIVLGGPMSVNDRIRYPWIAGELALIKDSVTHNRPVLGVCLGSQLLAAALGAKVYPARVKEVGCAPITLTPAAEDDPCLRNLDKELVVFQWHGDTFDLPAKAVRLARGVAVPNQAFRVGERTYALQFHWEATGAMVREWTAAYPDDVKSAGIPTAEFIINTYVANERALADRARSFFNACLDQSGLTESSPSTAT